MKIRYNISDNKQINYPKFFLIAGILIVISAVLITVGILRAAASSSQFRKEKEVLKGYKEKIDELKDKEAQNRNEIKKIDIKWGPQRRFINSLIDDKLFPYIGQLNQIEKILPGGVFIKKITLSTKAKNTLKFDIAAISGQKLLEAYKAFLPYNVVVNAENESKGLFTATITVQLKDETK